MGKILPGFVWMRIVVKDTGALAATAAAVAASQSAVNFPTSDDRPPRLRAVTNMLSSESSHADFTEAFALEKDAKKWIDTPEGKSWIADTAFHCLVSVTPDIDAA